MSYTLFVDSNRYNIIQADNLKYHTRYGKPVANLTQVHIDAEQLDPLTAAIAAHGGSNKWVAKQVIPLANSDEVHYAWDKPDKLDIKYPILLRWGVISNAASKAGALTTTYSKGSRGTNHAGSDDAGDGGTALDQTIAAITTSSNPGQDKPFLSQIGVINGASSDWDWMDIKLVSSGNTTADALRIWCLKIYYVPRYVD